MGTINAAGINLRQAPDQITWESWDQTLDLNLAVPFFLARELQPGMTARGRGRIINLASLQSTRAFPNGLAYGASKGGVAQLTRAMALDHAAEGIRVNAVCPGDVDTPMLEQEAEVDGISHGEALAVYGSQSPTGRVSTDDEVAALCLFLASDQAAQITGAAIPIDGGNTA